MTDRQQPLLVLYGRHIMVVVGSSQLVGSGHGRVKHLCSTPQLSSYVVRDDNRVRVQAFGQPGVVRDDRQLRPSSLHLLAACSHLSHKTAVCPAKKRSDINVGCGPGKAAKGTTNLIKQLA